MRDPLDRVDRAHLVHGFGSPAVTEAEGTLRLVRGRGVYVWDHAGRRYLDGVSSLWNVAVGHGRTEIARAVAAQMRALAFAPTLLGFSSEPAVRLAARIARLAPTGLTRVVFTSGGFGGERDRRHPGRGDRRGGCRAGDGPQPAASSARSRSSAVCAAALPG